jgi:hypothetical protein
LVSFGYVRRLRKAALIAGLIYVVVAGSVYAGMCLPPEAFSRAAASMPMGAIFAVLPVEMLWKSARGGRLHPGDSAPDFQLPLVNQTEQVRLSSLRGRPVFLIFGSYT